MPRGVVVLLWYKLNMIASSSEWLYFEPVSYCLYLVHNMHSITGARPSTRPIVQWSKISYIGMKADHDTRTGIWILFVAHSHSKLILKPFSLSFCSRMRKSSVQWIPGSVFYPTHVCLLMACVSHSARKTPSQEDRTSLRNPVILSDSPTEVSLKSHAWLCFYRKVDTVDKIKFMGHKKIN